MKRFLWVIAIICMGASLSSATASSTHEHKPFSQCVAMLATGFRCVSDARFGSTYCAFHSYPILLQCVVVINGYPCPKWAVANFRCEDHQNYQPVPPIPDLNDGIEKSEPEPYYIPCGLVTNPQGVTYFCPIGVQVPYLHCSIHGGKSYPPDLNSENNQQ